MPMMLAGRGIAGIGAAGFLSVVRIVIADVSTIDENNFQTGVFDRSICLSIFSWSVDWPKSISDGYSQSSQFLSLLSELRSERKSSLPASLAGMIIIFLLLRKKLLDLDPQRGKGKEI